MISRREVLKGASVTAVVALGGLGATCSPKKLTFWVRSAVGALNEIALLVPSQAANIRKIVAVANDFDKAYQEGRFANAVAIFQNFSSLVNTLVVDLGVNLSPQIKTTLAVINIAIRTVALLLNEQGENNAQAREMAESASGAQAAAIKTVKRLASKKDIDAIYEASKP